VRDAAVENCLDLVEEHCGRRLVDLARLLVCRLQVFCRLDELQDKIIWKVKVVVRHQVLGFLDDFRRILDGLLPARLVCHVLHREGLYTVVGVLGAGDAGDGSEGGRRADSEWDRRAVGCLWRTECSSSSSLDAAPVPRLYSRSDGFRWSAIAAHGEGRWLRLRRTGPRVAVVAGIDMSTARLRRAPPRVAVVPGIDMITVR